MCKSVPHRRMVSASVPISSQRQSEAHRCPGGGKKKRNHNRSRKKRQNFRHNNGPPRDQNNRDWNARSFAPQGGVNQGRHPSKNYLPHVNRDKMPPCNQWQQRHEQRPYNPRECVPLEPAYRGNNTTSSRSVPHQPISQHHYEQIGAPVGEHYIYIAYWGK
uniref:Gag polyprotein n=1 Tax=Steinernema glaseri TaxID=37863 RepID=A0A1I7Z3P0_9BILA